jgi:spore coat protein A, manganese oxidase
LADRASACGRGQGRGVLAESQRRSTSRGTRRGAPDGYAAKYGTANGVPQLDVSTLRPFLQSGLIAPDPAEAGLKETVKANPGQVTVVRARFSLPSTALNGAGKLVKPQRYVHHCHIVEREDNDMMERMIVVP